ncbi:MAG TPA: twin-arginine translocation signal domain-containing protein [Kofleriaceae bacterium]|nr:twin-arginine translocation signal domain-containing protein [Kofleriaceae bacterium]
MAFTRRSFLKAAGAAGAACAAAGLARPRRARAQRAFSAKHVVLLGIGGGLRRRESLGMAEGATLPNLFGNVPLVSGFGAGPAGAVKFAPEYLAMQPKLVTPPPLATPLYTQGALVTNLRYAAGAPGHLQGHATLISGAYNDLENRGDAHAPAPTLFELQRRQANTPATDAWYVSMVGGFYRTLQSSDHPEFGARFGGSFVSPPGAISEILPLITSGKRSLALKQTPDYPSVRASPDEAAATRKLTAILDGNYPAYPKDGTFRATAAENAALEDHLGRFYADKTYRAYYPSQVGIGLQRGGGRIDATPDALTIYHAEQILARFKPGVMVVTLLDIDACHDDYNGYLRGQLVADACARHLWEMIQSTDGLKDETALFILPEHGRHLFANGQNPDSFGRAGIDHGQGDDGDRDVWMLALGPDFKPGAVIDRTGVQQAGRTSGRWETIDATLTAATLLGHGDVMTAGLQSLDQRPGLVVEDLLR